MKPSTTPCPVRGYRREVPDWERRDMTVCIAAVCDENTDDPKIVICTDGKAGGALGSAEMTLKIRTVGDRGWRCLTSGADTDILACLPLFRKQFRAPVIDDETNVLGLVRAALFERKRDKAQEIIQGKFAIPYSEFLATGKSRLPDDVFRSATTEVELTQLEAEFILAGYDANEYPMLIKTDKKCSAWIKEDFVVAGDGAYLAQASLLNRGHENVQSLNRTIYTVFEAKRFAEGVPTVGKETYLMVLHRNEKMEMLGLGGEEFLDAKCKELGRQPISGIKLKPEFFTPIGDEKSS
jgi:hypothetical protein